MRETTTRSGRDGAAADACGPHVTATKPSTRVGRSLFIFGVEADPDPDVFARIANIFHIANVVPHYATLRRHSPDVVQMTVAIELSGVGVSELIHRKLAQLTSTISVNVVMGDSDTEPLTR